MALLSRFSPWAALTDLERQMDQLMKATFRGIGSGGQQLARTWAPAVDVFSRENDLVIRAELPGVDPEKDVDISVADGMLRIHGERRYEHRDEKENYFRMETSYGAFDRSIPLPEGVNVDDIKAVHRNGVLEVIVPGGAQIAPTKKIAVQIEGTGAEQQTLEAQPAAEPAGEAKQGEGSQQTQAA
ncbi:MAG TPA: Hsp20/alpha crystallin family protein [Actinomycetota bacterium]|nr:Hsp20/alpha crystallin family protein [Actinomycetota bacterium]